ncbi:MAG: PQQ-dependent sugar dehydrogenase, partial [Gammaproteobacteria bacterium]
LDMPHGFDFYRGWLYIAETGAIGRIRYDAKTRNTFGRYQRIVTDLPPGGAHWSRTLRFGEDGMMYVSVGSSCNVCLEKNPKRAALLRYQPDGSGGEIFASGLRNTVGFDWRPDTGELYGTDNGRDFLGDDFPPCELNRIEEGKFYGWPYANGNKIPDPDFGRGNEENIHASRAPAHSFGAHTAPLGITFLRNPNSPKAYRNAALVALHGSWNRSEKSGYKVVSLHFDDTVKIVERDFISGFEQDGDVIGRPVDIAEGGDGELYVSDDFSGSIYRVTPNAM